MVNSRESLAKIPSMNNDANPYIITLDIYKEGYWAYDISNYYKGRVDDNGTPFMVRWFEHGQLKNVQGLRPFIRGTVGQHTVDDQTDPDNPKVVPSPDCSQIDQTGETTDTEPGGIAIYRMVNQCFTQEGMFYGEIGLKDSSGLVLSSVDIAFKVLGGRMNMMGARKFYVSELEKAWLEMKVKFKDYDAQYKDQLEKELTDLNTKISNEIKRAEDTLGDTQAAIDANLASLKKIAVSVSALQAQIEADNLETRPEHIADITLLRQQIDRGISEISPYPETYADLNAVQQQYPTGTNKLIVTDDGHRAVFRNGVWKDGGPYQVAGIADNSITSNKLTNRTKMPWASWQNPVIVDYKNNVLTVPAGTHLLQGKLLFEGDTYIISESDKAKLAQESEAATTDEEKKKIKNFKPSYPGIFVSFDPNGINASNQFKFYDSLNEIPESEFYVGWINFSPVYNFSFIFKAISADDEYVTPDSLKSDFLKNTNSPRNDDFIYTESAWNFDFDHFTITMPTGATVQYKQDVFQIAPGTYPIADANNKSRYLYIYCDISNGSQIKIVGSTNQAEQTNTHVLIGYADNVAKIFYISRLTTSTYVKPKCKFINVENEKVRVDFNKKVIHFPSYVHAIIDSNNGGLPAFDLPLSDEDISDQSEASAYFVVVDPSANFSNDRTKCFKMYNYADNIINSYVKVLGWVDPNAKTYDFGELGSSFEEQKNQCIYPWAGKKITCFGDSITAGDDGEGSIIDSYVPRMKDILGTIPTNKGVCGSTITKAADRNDSFVERISDILDQDVITIFGGTNDFFLSRELGKFNDNPENPTTFYAALKYLILHLSEQNPMAKFLIMTPTRSSRDGWAKYDADGNLIKNKAGYTVDDYCNAIRKVAEYYSIPVLDLQKGGNYNPCIPSQKGHDALSADGLHPTAKGYDRLAQTIGHAINEL